MPSKNVRRKYRKLRMLALPQAALLQNAMQQLQTAGYDVVRVEEIPDALGDLVGRMVQMENLLGARGALLDEAPVAEPEGPLLPAVMAPMMEVPSFGAPFGVPDFASVMAGSAPMGSTMAGSPTLASGPPDLSAVKHRFKANVKNSEVNGVKIGPPGGGGPRPGAGVKMPLDEQRRVIAAATGTPLQAAPPPAPYPKMS